MRILLVEDHDDTLDVISRLLILKGHHIVAARSATEAEKLFEKGEIDVMLCDIMLPDRLGWTLGAVAKRYKVPAIALTALAGSQDIEMSRRAGFAAHLTKPLHIDAIIEALGSVAPAKVTD